MRGWSNGWSRSFAERTTKVANRARWQGNRLRQGAPTADLVYEDDAASRVSVTKGPAAIEPRFGYIVTPEGVLLDQSVEPNFEYDTSVWRLGTPSHRLVRRAMGECTVVAHDAVVSLRHFWDWNYYHFLLDVLGKLELYEQVGLDSDIPIALSWVPHQQPFVRELLSTGSLPERTWLIPDLYDDTQVIRADRVYFARTRRPYARRVDHLLELLQAPSAAVDADDRVFLTRRPPAGRKLANEAEVEEYLSRLGFRTVDALALSIREQMDLFSQVRHLVAVHGAGITNMIFRARRPMSVLDLHSELYPGPGDMERLSNELGYHYEQLAGPGTSPDDVHADFTIALEELRPAVELMLRT